MVLVAYHYLHIKHRTALYLHYMKYYASVPSHSMFKRKELYCVHTKIFIFSMHENKQTEGGYTNHCADLYLELLLYSLKVCSSTSIHFTTSRINSFVCKNRASTVYLVKTYTNKIIYICEN